MAASKAMAIKRAKAAPKPQKTRTKATAKKPTKATKAPRTAPAPRARATVTRAAGKAARLAGSPLGNALLPRLREICLALPETSEVEAWGHPTFRVAGKIFVGFGADQGKATLGVKTTPDLQAALVASDPRFTIAAYVGKHGWVSLDMSGRVDWGEVENLVRESYRLVAPRKLARHLEEAAR
jgi:predicted DNA-binding protein (MmcQ/YjbR family)